MAAQDRPKPLLEGSPQPAATSPHPLDSQTAADDDTAALDTEDDTSPAALAAANRAAVSRNAELAPNIESFQSPASLPVIPKYHIRTPSAAGLSLQTDLPSELATTLPSQSPNTPTRVGSRGGVQIRASATAPIAIPGASLRSTLSAASMTSSLSPGSAVSSPMLNALTDITPLPSPLAMGDSPGPWMRATHARPGSRGSSGVTRDDSFLLSTSVTSPSKKKKTYSGLMPTAVEGASLQSYQKSESGHGHGRDRSLSEFVPEPLHNTRPRQVTVSAGYGHIEAEAALHREQYLAAQRGPCLAVPASQTGPQATLPTPPASNRSVTESEEEEIPEDTEGVKYLTVRHKPNTRKKLWRCVRLLGQGTFSKVYLATSEKITAKDPLDESTLNPRKLVAIKVVEHGPAGGADEQRVELSLKREVEMLKSVSHPSLVHLRTFDYDDQEAHLVLTYCPGGDLFDLASEHRDLLTPALLQRVNAEMVGAVRYLHSELIVHRDIKLENVLLNIPAATLPSIQSPQSYRYPLITLTDLGLSRKVSNPQELLTTRCGSEDYAAPEILLGQPYDGRATDAWALGVLLYALMEGRLPFDPPPGKAGARSRAAHRIARCDWMWHRFGDADGEWDPKAGAEWEGGREVVEGLLKKVSRGRKSLDQVAEMEWVRHGISVEGGLKRREHDLEDEMEVER
ncbi:Pkinase-domain-containing protein [Mytilinidion resinicola]|uniref:Pkinase-domain-containing protein n=1 Tax=Mytilinidion resinicola TaxID=574789 RepID=A0A6A6YDV1_9PEZI|nr:Pkinase-domain-containing protein [Mytilinidion resinicola]KAF2806174.1 Pkinase-domain-containing protein [Mytilinidion resinicola]